MSLVMAQTLRLFTHITPVLLQLAFTLRTADCWAQPTPPAAERQPEGQSPTKPAVDAAAPAQAPAAEAPPAATDEATKTEATTPAAETSPEAVPSGNTANSGPCPCSPPPSTASNAAVAGAQGAGASMQDTPPRPAAPKLPIRELNPWALSGDVGWNSLVGFGPVVTRHLSPHFSLDAGAGLSLEGIKFGGRARYNFLKSDLTPFVGVGAMHALGVDKMTINEPNEDEDSIEPGDFVADVRIKPSTYAQVVTGLDWIDRNNNINLTGTIGYAHLLQRDNVEVLAGSLEGEHEDAADVGFGSGLVVSLGMGYSF